MSIGALCAATSVAFAQISPGVPGGVLNDEFRLQEHPFLFFVVLVFVVCFKKFQNGRSQRRKRGDNGAPDGCNLQCPQDQ